MHENFESLIQSVAGRKEFEIDLLIDEGGQNVAVGVTISAMARVLSG
jgi:hypothetical protein